MTEQPETPQPISPEALSDPVAAAQALTGALERMTGELATVNRRLTRTRHMVVAIAISLVLDLTLTGLVSVGYVRLGHATATATAASNRAAAASTAARHASVSSYALCKAGNTARAQQLGLWTYLLDKSVKPGAKEPPVLKQFTKIVDRDFAPRDCAALGGKK